MTESIIQCQQLGKTFGDQRVLRGIDLDVPKGAIVGLLGNNGAGKSTLIKCLLGLLRVSSGTATVMGEDPWELSARAKSRLGYVPQEVKFYPWMKVRQIIKYTGSFYQNWDNDWCAQMADRLEVDTTKWVRTLSAGQMQRLALVLAMGHRPDLMILDEPAASLDPAGRRSLLRTLLEANQGQGQTVLFSTHITSDLERVASHVAMLSGGVVEYFGELGDLKDSVKRLRIHSVTELPTDLVVPRSLHTVVSGQDAVVAVAACDELLIEELRREWNASVEVEDLNLEEIFLEMHDA